MNPTVHRYATAVTAAGAAVLLLALGTWHAPDLALFGLYAALAIVAGCMKIRLPGMDSTLSPGFILILLTAVSLSWQETTVVSVIAALAQNLWRPKSSPTAQQIGFNAANLALSGGLAHWAAAAVRGGNGGLSIPTLVAGLLVLYFSNIAAVSVVVCLLRGKPLRSVLELCNYYTFPAYLAGTMMVWLVVSLSAGQRSVSLIPLALVVPSYFYYKRWLGMAEQAAPR